MFGLESNTQIIGTSLLDHIASSHREQMRQIVERRAAGEFVPTFYETRGLAANGCEFDIEISAAAYESQGEMFTLATIRDITERRQAEAALRQSQERYMLAERAVADGLWDWNIITDEEYFSPRWKEILGYEDAELPNLKSTFLNRIHADDLARVDEMTRAHLERGEHYALEFRLRHKDGSYRWVFSRGEAMLDAEGRPIRMVGGTTDIRAFCWWTMSQR